MCEQGFLAAPEAKTTAIHAQLVGPLQHAPEAGSPAPRGSQHTDAMTAFLAPLCLDMYAMVLAEQGIVNPSQLVHLTAEDLEGIGFKHLQAQIAIKASKAAMNSL